MLGHSILSQVKCIKKGGLLSEYEKREIERKTKDEIHNNIGEKSKKKIRTQILILNAIKTKRVWNVFQN